MVLVTGTCFAWLCEIVIVESSWLTTTEYSLASQGSSRVCETVRLSVGGKRGASLREVSKLRRIKPAPTLRSPSSLDIRHTRVHVPSAPQPKPHSSCWHAEQPTL